MPLIDVPLGHREVPEHFPTRQKFQQPYFHESVAALIGVNEFPEEHEIFGVVLLGEFRDFEVGNPRIMHRVTERIALARHPLGAGPVRWSRPSCSPR